MNDGWIAVHAAIGGFGLGMATHADTATKFGLIEAVIGNLMVMEVACFCIVFAISMLLRNHD
jgi:hypothetical protein